MKLDTQHTQIIWVSALLSCACPFLLFQKMKLDLQFFIFSPQTMVFEYD